METDCYCLCTFGSDFTFHVTSVDFQFPACFSKSAIGVEPVTARHRSCGSSTQTIDHSFEFLHIKWVALMPNVAHISGSNIFHVSFICTSNISLSSNFFFEDNFSLVFERIMLIPFQCLNLMADTCAHVPHWVKCSVWRENHNKKNVNRGAT